MTARPTVLVLALFLAACATQKSLPVTPSLHLSQIDFDQLPGWQISDPTNAIASFERGCAILMQKPDQTPMGGKGYAGTVGDWREVCRGAAHPDAKDFFRRNFTPYAVAGQALFTGYYEPLIQVSRTQHDDYQTPVYGLPSDLVRADLGLFDPKYKGEHIWGRVSDQNLVPYRDRATIENDGLSSASVLFYTNDPIGLFFLQIQGSGRVEFDDGLRERIVYAGDNGQPYTAIGRVLIADGSMTRAQVSLQSIRMWLLAHPDKAKAVMQSNKSYVFFREEPLGATALGSAGTLGADLTPLASLAIDPRFHALGIPFFVDAEGKDQVQALLIGQDTGGAIRGPARGDIFFGFGPEAQARAGTMNEHGRLFLLLPNGLAKQLGQTVDYPP